MPRGMVSSAEAAVGAKVDEAMAAEAIEAAVGAEVARAAERVARTLSHSWHPGLSARPALKRRACGHCRSVHAERKPARSRGPHSLSSVLRRGSRSRYTQAKLGPQPIPSGSVPANFLPMFLPRHLRTDSSTASLTSAGESKQKSSVTPSSVVTHSGPCTHHPRRVAVAT